MSDLAAKIEQSIAILRAHEPPEGYHLAFSGGKDSIVVLDNAKEARVKYDAHYYNITVDPPELLHLIRHHYPEVQFENPKHSFNWHVWRRGLPTRRFRWCCDQFKERHGKGRSILTGSRRDESTARKHRGLVETCKRYPGKLLIHPIIDWTEEDVWNYIEQKNLPYCPLYDEGWDRIGCVICPMERKIEQSMNRWPHIWEALHKAVLYRWAHHIPQPQRWHTGEDLWQWWLNRDSTLPSPISGESEADEEQYEEEGMPSHIFSSGTIAGFSDL